MSGLGSILSDLIKFIAGKRAAQIIREEGLNPDRIRVLVGAAGGAKSLVLGGIDDHRPPVIPAAAREDGFVRSLTSMAQDGGRRTFSKQDPSPSRPEPVG